MEVKLQNATAPTVVKLLQTFFLNVPYDSPHKSYILKFQI